jgi:DNA-binding beta-propeller fold protein YncE
MNSRYLWLVFLVFSGSLSAQQKKTINLPSSKKLMAPAPGDPRAIGSLPTNIVVSPNGKYAAILENGYGTTALNQQQGIAVLNLETSAITEFPDARLGPKAKQSYFLGLVFSGDGKYLYASMGSLTDPTGKSAGDTGNGIAVYSFADGKVAPERFIKIPPQKVAQGKRVARVSENAPKGTAVPYPAGLAVVSISGAEKLLVADNLSDDVLLIDAASGNIEKRFDVSTSEWVPASFPYAVVATKDGKRAWVSLWNASQVAELDLEKGAVVRWIKLHPPKSATDPGSHPTAMALGGEVESALAVTLANTDEIAIVNTANGIATLQSAALPGQRAVGAYPNAVAFNENGTEYFVANASSDAVVVFDLGRLLRVVNGESLSAWDIKFDHERAVGFIPTEWYPTALAVHGDELLVVSGKAQGSGPNAPSSEASDRAHASHPYIATLLHGSVARIKIPEAEKNLPALTKEVLDSNLMSGRANAIPFKAGKNPIHHVIYIIKENRTYDQLFGDLGVGDGDPSLAMYGEDITPNQHKLARQFGVLDNFYDSGEVSGNGHVWSTAAITSDYTERTWQITYRGDERTYDFEGAVANEYPIKQGIGDVNEPGTGYLWTNMAKHGITYRHYGEYVSSHFCDRGGDADLSPLEGTPLPMPEHCAQEVSKPGQPLPSAAGVAQGPPNPYQWEVPLLAENVATKPELVNHFDPNYPDFRLDFPDQLRVDEFLREFNGWMDQKKNAKADPMPQFIILRLPNDHTAGKRPGMPTPSASVADNDLAVGRVAESISHSPYWNDTAIFVLEDDAQNGADHVDAHRSIALAISKYSPSSLQKPFVDHNFYTTVNTIHTMEVLLGVPAMNNNDAQAAVMAPLFSGTGNQPAFEADYRNQENDLIYQANPPHGQGAKESMKMDFSHADAVDTAKLNRILWRDRMGKRPEPKPQHNVLPASAKEDDDD